MGPHTSGSWVFPNGECLAPPFNLIVQATRSSFQQAHNCAMPQQLKVLVQYAQGLVHSLPGDDWFGNQDP